MRSRCFVIASIFIVFLCHACNKAMPRAVEDNARPAISDEEAPHLDGAAGVKLSEDLASMLESGVSPSAVFPDLDGVEAYRLFPKDSVFEARQRKAGLHRWYVLKYDRQISDTKASASLKSIDGVQIVEPLIPAVPDQAGIPFNDPDAAKYQWHLFNSGTLYSGFKKGADINVLPVWKDYTAGTSNVIVAVIDTGVQYDHPDLNGVVIPPGENGSKSFLVKNLLSPYSYQPQNHATHVAGIIAAINNNGIGGCGIAGGSNGTGGVRILDCQAIGSSEGESGYPTSALVWAANHGAVIANNSWSLTYDSVDKVPDNTPSSYADAIDYFIENAGTDSNGNQTGPMKGGVVFFSAGNKGWDKGQPAMYERAIAVGATGPAGEKSTYSNYGDWVDICAPGGNHNAYGNQLAQIYSTKASDTYGFMQGTSMSCPVASGAAALLVSYFGGAGFTNTKLAELIINGADFENAPSGLGGQIDVYESIYSNGKTISPVKDLKIVTSKNGINLIFPINAYGNRPVYACEAAISTDRSRLEHLDPFNIPQNVIHKKIYTSNGKIGGKELALFDKLAPGVYYATVVSYEKNHKYSTNNDIISAEIFGNRPPVIIGGKPETIVLNHYQKDSLHFEYSDPDGDQITLSVARASVADVWRRPATGQLDLIITGGAADPGTYTTVCTLTDIDGAVTKYEQHYTLLQNEVPVITVLESGIAELMRSKSTSYVLNISDAEGDPLTVVTDPGSTAGNWSQTGPAEYRLDINGRGAPSGDYRASLTVDDGFGGHSSYYIDYRLLPNRAPILTRQPDNIILQPNETRTLDMSSFFSDPDEDKLYYNASSQSSKLDLSYNKSSLTLSGAGTSEVTSVSIIATDEEGANVSTTFKVRTIAEAGAAEIFPATVTDKLTISCPTDCKATIEIYQSTGRKLYSKTLSMDPFIPFDINVSNLAPGRYVVSVSTDKGSIKKTIVKI
ncbi:MAG: S8 family serine peptidase [Bacteroidales bacterium]|nr:S8 family serine peptidase [Bacteroidales bacterium]